MKNTRNLLLILILLLQAACAALGTGQRRIPDDLIYDEFVLLIFTPRQDLPLYQREEAMLVNNVEGLAERDVMVYRLFQRSGLSGSNKELNHAFVLNLRTEHQVNDDQFMNILIGKDGEVKLRKEGFMAPESLFSFIDTLYVR